MGCLIVFKSVTYAQSAASMLARCGIGAYLTRSPSSMGAGSCSYGLKINSADCAKAASILKASPIPVKGIFTALPNGDYRSMSL